MTANSVTPATIDKIYEQGAASRAPIERADGGQELLLPDGYTTHTIPPLEPKLPRIRQSVTFYDLESFTAYVNDFKTEASRIFAMPGHLSLDKEAKLKAVLDYHKGAGSADYGAHVAAYIPKYSEPWRRWMKAAGTPMLQADFGEFVEENRADIREPEAAALLDMVNKFKATKKVDFNAVTNQPNGDVVIGYSEQTEVQGNRAGVQVPTELILGVPVFFKGEPYRVRMIMRYKLGGGEGKLTFTIKPDRPEYIEQDAFDDIAKAVAEATDITPFLGVPA